MSPALLRKILYFLKNEYIKDRQEWFILTR